ncbi:probable palmitoyltransferase ZDHHC24 [Mercenaria mercenaria]|uniref:probable palmitoyltransferase ZDHHC24 n=1 Tax=Mercenaria mercenaria TaxID=6596 RepID=UPI00234EE476|nr:probable palmitoyltransferase ZDHHC24 [Mercenaria mercenaria]
MRHWKRLLPKNATDTFAYIFTLFGINSIFYFELLYVLPKIVSEEENYSSLKWYFHVTCGCVIYCNALSSFWKIISTETSVRGLILPSILKPGWRFCPICECNAPSRSYHCFACKTCILRRDHHCVFTGNCIGQKNHRYYMLLLFYNALAGLYASIMNLNIAWTIVGTQWFPLSVVKLIFPLFAWILGYTTFSNMLLSAILLLCMAAMCAMSGLLFYHMKNLYYGQITHESSHKIFKYDLGWRENVRAVMGENWKIGWLSPWLPSALPGDGLEFPLAGVYESPKDI